MLLGCRLLVNKTFPIILLALICCACGGNGEDSLELTGSAQPVPDPPGAPAMAWPPDETGVRQTSDDEITYTGADYDSASGNHEVQQDGALKLTGKDPLTYALFSAGPYVPIVQFSHLRVQHFVEEAAPGDGTRLYIALANYSKGRWEFYNLAPGLSTLNVPNPQQYVSPLGNAHAAMINWGDGSSFVVSVTFVRSGPTSTDIPQNLVGTPQVGEIHLDWDAVNPSVGYNVYRSTNPQFTLPEKLNEALVTDTSYIDVCATHKIWFYRVTAVYGFESGMSNMVDVFCPRIDLPAPENLRVTAVSLTSITLVWDWPLPDDPDLWKIFYKGEPHFNLEEPIGSKNVPAFSRTTTLNNLVPGETVYFRCVAVDPDGKMGRMTDDIGGTTRKLYDWGDIEEIGVGTYPLRVIVADGDLTATFLENTFETRLGPWGEYVGEGGKVKVARRDQGDWSVQDISTGVAFDNNNLAQFYGYIDLAHSPAGYLVTAHTKFSDDLWAFDGAPGEAWTGLRLAGDGGEGPGHPFEGVGVRTVSNGSEFATCYLNSSPQQVVLRRRPVEGSDEDWSSRVIVDDGLFGTQYHSIAYNPEGELSIMHLDLSSGDLLVGEEEFDFSMFSVLDPEVTYVGAFNDMEYIDNHWYASAFDGPNEKLVLINDGSQPWQMSPVSYRKIEAGNHSRLTQFQGKPMVLYYGMPPAEYLGNEQRWYFGLFEEGDWHTEWIKINGYEYFDFGPEAELVDLDGQLYFIFEDQAEEMIKAARAEPPDL